jgi:prophage DNA circulation protein
MSLQEKTKIDSLNIMMKELIKEQQKIDSTILNYNEKINNLDKNISTIKGQKIIIKEIYHDEINRVSNYTDAELDSFFTSRYGYYYSY